MERNNQSHRVAHNELVYSFVAIQFLTTSKASDSAPNLQRFQNTMRQSMFFLVSELQMM